MLSSLRRQPGSYCALKVTGWLCPTYTSLGLLLTTYNLTQTLRGLFVAAPANVSALIIRALELEQHVMVYLVKAL